MTLREAAQQALEALENSRPIGNDDDFAGLMRLHNKAITALRAALAEPQRKPLTEEDVAKIMDFGQYGRVPEYAMNFVRAIEAAHGIGDSNGS